MKKTDAFFYRLAMPFPMACPKVDGATEDKTVDGITYKGFTEIANDSVDGAGELNFQQGFPGVYSVPKSLDGKYVTRGQMNAIGNLASQNQFYFMAGGLNTFDRDFCDTIGGYPKDAVLIYLDGNFLYYVISLVDDNKIDFRLGVDGINWKLLVATQDYVPDGNIFFEGGRDLASGDALIGVAKAKQSGFITLSNSIKPIESDNEASQINISKTTTNDIQNIDFGCSLMIKDLGESPSGDITRPHRVLLSDLGAAYIEWNEWKHLSGDFTFLGSPVYTANSNGSYSKTPGYTIWKSSTAGIFTSIEVNHYYAIALLCGSGSYSIKEFTGEYVFTINGYSSLSGHVKITYS